MLYFGYWGCLAIHRGDDLKKFAISLSVSIDHVVEVDPVLLSVLDNYEHLKTTHIFELYSLLQEVPSPLALDINPPLFIINHLKCLALIL